MGCSLAAGRGDELSDVDAAVGYEEGVGSAALEGDGLELVRAAGPTLDVLVHRLPGWPEDTLRLAVEYRAGVQLDLVLMPAAARLGVPDGSVAVVDKDGILATPWRPSVAGPPEPGQAREWVLLGWWALSDTAKHLRRGSLHEAAERLHEARAQALRLFAVAEGVPYPAFGLVSLLDFPPFELPSTLSETYPVPRTTADVLLPARRVADLLYSATIGAGTAMGIDLATPWEGLARTRLDLVPHEGPPLE